MGGGIEAVYIFDQHNNSILQHVYNSRPASASTLLPLYLDHIAPRPSLIYLPNTSPPTLLFSILHSNLLFLSPTSVDVEPLLVLEFLHRVVDVLEEFLGAPLLASKIEGSYDVVAQLLGEMCDAGSVSNTEPNALRDIVEVPGWMDKLLGGVGLPSVPSASSSSTTALPFQKPAPKAQTTGPQLPWRRANVRHTSNELYVDIVESLFVTIAPSGRPLAAFANGSIAFTSKISGVPSLLLTLSAPGGKTGLERALELPVFHPCVRLAHWRDRPGELSFVPPDGRFVLAGYEVDLLPSFTTTPSATNLPSLSLPVSLEIRTGLGPNNADFEARLTLVHPSGTAAPSSASSSSSRNPLAGRLGTSSPAFGTSSSSAAPTLEAVSVSIPIPNAARTLNDLRATRGEAMYAPGDRAVEWRLSTKEASGSGTATLRCTVIADHDADDDYSDGDDGNGDKPMRSSFAPLPSTYDYDEADVEADSRAATTAPAPVDSRNKKHKQTTNKKNSVRPRKPTTAGPPMPTAATVSFAVRGWLASGVRVESLNIDTRASRGLSEGVKPYKGVKYLSVSRGGVEVRCG
ncbi:MAG: hypothetical protein M1825_006216 [Sarcosagium campestre]|nr:MAG: hypothetical protein M1825_006216 [Sarcosagium campestre]